MPHNPAADSAPTPVPVDLPLERRLGAAIELYGEADVIARALGLMAGKNEGADFLLYVGGEHAQGVLDGAPVLFWPELWGLRALLYVWDDSAIAAVIHSLNDPAWRVREMGARVIAARGLPAVVELTQTLADGVPRVRVAAARALGAVGSPEDMDSLRKLLKDPLVEVRRGAQQGLDTLRDRFR